jgi:DNA-binding PadR family transcriptional regulator
MSLRHSLLGLLAEGPASGYDLARRFQEALGTVWPAQHPQIYAELGKLAAVGMIEVDSHGPRRRTSYRITDEGLAEVRRWLAQGEVDHTIRFEPLLRSYFFWLLDPGELADRLAGEQRYYEEFGTMLRALAAAKDRGEWGTGPQTRAQRMTVEAVLRLSQAMAEWAAWAAENDLMANEDFGTALEDRQPARD